VATAYEIRRALVAAVLVPVVTLGIGGGCSPPQVEGEHRELLLGLVTAASARDQNLLEQAERLIEVERKAGRLSTATDEAFSDIVKAGRAGDWDRASGRAFSLRDAQEPTEADLARLRNREMPKPKLPPGGRGGGPRHLVHGRPDRHK
jgi:hypothetical protein